MLKETCNSLMQINECCYEKSTVLMYFLLTFLIAEVCKWVLDYIVADMDTIAVRHQ